MTSRANPGMLNPVPPLATDISAVRALFVGSVHVFPYVPADPWWVPCFGQTLSVASYPALAAKFGVASGTFTLPDYRGRVVAGADNMGGTSANRLTTAGGLNGDGVGRAGGSETVTLTTAELPAHTHTASLTINSGGAHSHTIPKGGTGGGGGAQNGPTDSATITSSVDGAHTHTGSVTVDSAGSGGAHKNVQPTITAYYCILAY